LARRSFNIGFGSAYAIAFSPAWGQDDAYPSLRYQVTILPKISMTERAEFVPRSLPE